MSADGAWLRTVYFRAGTLEESEEIELRKLIRRAFVELAKRERGLEDSDGQQQLPFELDLLDRSIAK